MNQYGWCHAMEVLMKLSVQFLPFFGKADFIKIVESAVEVDVMITIFCEKKLRLFLKTMIKYLYNLALF
jgi:hypothetical protein